MKSEGKREGESTPMEVEDTLILLVLLLALYLLVGSGTPRRVPSV